VCVLVLSTRVAAQGDCIVTVAGNGSARFGGDGGLGFEAQLNSPNAIAVDPAGGLFIADTSNHRIRRLSATGVITTVAGNGTAAFGGDGGPATSAALSGPRGMVANGAGGLFVADTGSNRVRFVSASGIISTVAGTGAASRIGDGGPATLATLDSPRRPALDGAGNLFIADYGNDVIRRVDSSGVITTVAGDGASGSVGDGGPATSAKLAVPLAVALDGAGGFMVSVSSSRVRLVNAAGIIATVAGNGTAGFGGDGGPATLAKLSFPSRYIATPQGPRARKPVAFTSGASASNP